MEINKRMSAAALPIVAMVVLGVFDGLVDVSVPSLGTTVGIFVLVADLAILGWAGFKAAKENGAIMDSAVTGSIAGGVSFFISILLSIVLGVDIPFSDTPTLIVITIVGVILGVIFGAIFGAAGGFLCRKMKAGDSKVKT